MVIKIFKCAKIWPLLDLLAKFGRMLACSCSQNFRNCSHARILVEICLIARNSVNPAISQSYGTWRTLINKRIKILIRRRIPANGKSTKCSLLNRLFSIVFAARKTNHFDHCSCSQKKTQCSHARKDHSIPLIEMFCV